MPKKIKNSNSTDMLSSADLSEAYNHGGIVAAIEAQESAAGDAQPPAHLDIPTSALESIVAMPSVDAQAVNNPEFTITNVDELSKIVEQNAAPISPPKKPRRISAKNEPKAAAPKVVQQELALDMIRIDMGTQSRAKIDADTVALYADHMEDGAQFPAIDVFEVNSESDAPTYVLVDGHHRYLAAQKLGLKTFNCNVQIGTLRDAQLASLAANSDPRGLQRNRQDMRSVVMRTLTDPEWKDRSVSWIAEACKVSATFVKTIMDDMASTLTTQPITANVPAKRTVVGKDGRTYNVSKIGSKTGKKKPAVVTPDEIETTAAVIAERAALRSGLEKPTKGMTDAATDVAKQMITSDGGVTIHDSDGEPMHVPADTPVVGADGQAPVKSPLTVTAADVAMLENMSAKVDRHLQYKNGGFSPFAAFSIVVDVTVKEGKLGISGNRVLLSAAPSDLHFKSSPTEPFKELLDLLNSQPGGQLRLTYWPPKPDTHAKTQPVAEQAESIE